ncbi:response regulator [Parafrankia sp. EAN1pec]|uniref:ATP-binding response regulator n=1 Tax=Parafrankia sp. (strain EAN1pec) TaxID=298653 RepID=UPI00321ACC94
MSQNPARNLTAKQVEYAHVIHSAGADLLQLVNDILDLSKVEAGKMEIHMEHVSLRALLEDLRATFHPITEENGLEFTVDVAPDAPTELFTDSQRVSQVLRNLLSNAVKFTEQGCVELRIRTTEGPDGAAGPRKTVAFSVVDTGVGIADDDLDRLFEAFQQGEGPTNRRYGGTGLGLSISREVAALLDGELHLSTANLDEEPALTRDVTEPVERSPIPQAPAHEELHGRKTLVIDDDVRNIFAITSVLELYGITVIYASDGREGIDTLLATADVDIVLVDVMMPEMDGYATMTAIRQIPQFATIPVIAVTAKAMPHDREKCLAAGATDYVTKPVDTEELLIRMERQIT